MMISYEEQEILKGKNFRHLLLSIFIFAVSAILFTLFGEAIVNIGTYKAVNFCLWAVTIVLLVNFLVYYDY